MINKKAVSEVVAYSMLIVISIGISVLVFAFLKLYVPVEKVTCDDSISIVIRDLECNVTAAEKTLFLNLENKGLFNISGVIARITRNQSYSTKQTIGEPFFSKGLAPGDNRLISFNITSQASSPGTYYISVQPKIRNDKNKLVYCDNVILTQEIECT